MMPGMSFSGFIAGNDEATDPTVPAAFTSGQWSIVTGATGQANGTIITPPDDGGAAIIRYEYWNGSAWVSIGLLTSFVLSGSPSEVVNVKVRAVNSVGNGPDSDTKAVTLGAATAPAAFTAGMWTVSPGGSDGSISVGIGSLPSNGGSALTTLQYRTRPTSGSFGAWTSAGTLSSFSVLGLGSGSTGDIQIRAVNAVGPGPDSDTKAYIAADTGGGGGK